MLQQTRAWVINRTKYGDNGLVLHTFTREYGYKSYFISGISHTKNSKFKPSFFLPFQEIEIIAHSTKGNLQRIKEINLFSHYKTLHTEFSKQSVALFLSEVMQSLVQNEQANIPFYEKVKELLIWFDEYDHTANFHLHFLIECIHFLGFLPETDTSQPYFDLAEGKFTSKPLTNQYIEGSVVSHFKVLTERNIENTANLSLSYTQRHILVEVLMEYLALHQFSFKKPKSIVVLKEMFH